MREKSQRGAALVLVLMIVAIMSVVVIGAISKNKLLVKEARMLKEYRQGITQLASVRSQLVYILTTTTLWSSGANIEEKSKLGLPEDFNLYGQEFEYLGAKLTIQSLNGLISLEPFDEDSFKSFLLSKGYKQSKVLSLVDAIKDWIDEDDFVRLNGAEKHAYLHNSMPRNAPFQMVQELRLVKGMTPEIWADIQPYVVLFGGEPINNHYVPTDIIGFSESEINQESLKSARAKGKTPIWYTGDSSEYPGERLQISISLTSELTQYSESFTLIKTRGIERPFVISDVVVGKL